MMISNKLAELMFMATITCHLLLTIHGESRLVFNGDRSVTVAATEGDIIDLKCTDTTFTVEHYIIWYRKKVGGVDTEIYRNEKLTLEHGQEALAYSLNSSTEFELTISITSELGQWLHGNGYRCIVMKTTGGTLFNPSVYNFINVNYPPPVKFPFCVASSYQNDSIGQNVILSCYSEPGNPRTTIEWWRDNVMLKDTTIGFQNSIRFELIYLNYTFNLQQQDLQATYQCRVKWFNEVIGCIVNPKSSQPSTQISTTEHETTVSITTTRKTSSESMAHTTMPQEALTRTSKPTWLQSYMPTLDSDASMTGTSSAILTGNTIMPQETLTRTIKPTWLPSNMPSLDLDASMTGTSSDILISLTTKETSSNEASTFKDNLIYYIIGGLVIGCAIILIMIICIIRKKTSSRQKSSENHEMQTGEWKKVDSNLQPAIKQADNLANTGIVTNSIYEGLADQNESMSNTCRYKERLKMEEKTAPEKTKSTGITEDKGNIGRVRENNTGLRVSHVMIENTVYAGLEDPPIPMTKAGDNTSYRDSPVMEENAIYAGN